MEFSATISTQLVLPKFNEVLQIRQTDIQAIDHRVSQEQDEKLVIVETYNSKPCEQFYGFYQIVKKGAQYAY